MRKKHIFRVASTYPPLTWCGNEHTLRLDFHPVLQPPESDAAVADTCLFCLEAWKEWQEEQKAAPLVRFPAYAIQRDLGAEVDYKRSSEVSKALCVIQDFLAEHGLEGEMVLKTKAGNELPARMHVSMVFAASNEEPKKPKAY